jgi:hypothetical protein
LFRREGKRYPQLSPAERAAVRAFRRKYGRPRFSSRFVAHAVGSYLALAGLFLTRRWCGDPIDRLEPSTLFAPLAVPVLLPLVTLAIPFDPLNIPAVIIAWLGYAGGFGLTRFAQRHWPDRWAARLAAGLCPVCGYDLRASRDRCPECGTAAEVKP